MWYTCDKVEKTLIFTVGNMNSRLPFHRTTSQHCNCVRLNGAHPPLPPQFYLLIPRTCGYVASWGKWLLTDGMSQGDDIGLSRRAQVRVRQVRITEKGCEDIIVLLWRKNRGHKSRPLEAKKKIRKWTLAGSLQKERHLADTQILFPGAWV